ncbi:heme peroxidase [Mycena galericulata]|nr:heme peroxidase [Mycena galericulata]
MLLATTIVAFLATTASTYTWPSPQLDAFESARFDQEGFAARGIAAFIKPCDLFFFGNNLTGRSDAADWIRTAYHDMATHNVADGTGGLDASIRFAEEQARAENAGDGFQNTFIALTTLSNRYVSIPNTLAVGVIIAIENCGGPEIAFRGGRIDAGEPNAQGVPEPQQDLNAHIASFARQGFTQVEMIGLVACGHTFGGVQHDPFPDIVGPLNDPTNTQDVAHFDLTPVNFDNNVATEYISGSTKNPLVVGFNETTNSDKRIFASDGNATMLSFAKSPELFASTCADLFARMLNTVPKGVHLTDVITPLPVKPTDVEIILDADNKLQLSGQVRFWNMTQQDATRRKVQMLWKDHVKGRHNVTLGLTGISSSSGGRHSAAWYTFNATVSSTFLLLDPAAGITNMQFIVDGVVEDQGGVGFAVQDAFAFSETSCVTAMNDTTHFPSAGRFDVAIRNNANPTRVYLEQVARDSVQRPTITEIDIAPPAHPVAANAAYNLWSINLTDAFAQYTIGAEIGGVRYSTNDDHSLLEFPLCAT